MVEVGVVDYNISREFIIQLHIHIKAMPESKVQGKVAAPKLLPTEIWITLA
jgi:hypothetical protein